jgi:hypothetical protein
VRKCAFTFRRIVAFWNKLRKHNQQSPVGTLSNCAQRAGLWPEQVARGKHAVVCVGPWGIQLMNPDARLSRMAASENICGTNVAQILKLKRGYVMVPHTPLVFIG